MFKSLTAILVSLTLIFSIVPAYAENHNQVNVQENIQNSVIYKSEIEVTEKGGVYQVGFVTIKFPKNFIDDGQLPKIITVEVSAVNGVPGIEFTPDIPDFNKDVTIIVHPYHGLLFDKSTGANVPVNVRNQKINVKHFSRYAFS